MKINELYNLDSDIGMLLKDFIYPWEVLPNISILIDKLKDSYTLYKDDIYIGKNVTIDEKATIIGPAIIGDNTVIRPGAYLRGNIIIGQSCVIGNSCEIKNSIILNNAQIPHFNYVGDSIIGTHAHFGAGVITSNVKSDKKNVVINNADDKYPTNLKKVGAFIGDYVEVGCNSVLCPGSIVGKNSNIYPLVNFRGVIGENKIVKSLENIIDKENY